MTKNTAGGGKDFFMRSTLVQQLIPRPADGHVRAKFNTGKCTASDVYENKIFKEPILPSNNGKSQVSL